MQLFQNMGKYSMINNVVYRQSSNKYSSTRRQLNDDSIDKSTDTSMRNSRWTITQRLRWKFVKPMAQSLHDTPRHIMHSDID